MCLGLHIHLYIQQQQQQKKNKNHQFHLFIDYLIFSNKDILVRHSLLPSRNVSMGEYEAVMLNINATESAILELEECSLSTQLDNVSLSILLTNFLFI